MLIAHMARMEPDDAARRNKVDLRTEIDAIAEMCDGPRDKRRDDGLNSGESSKRIVIWRPRFL